MTQPPSDTGPDPAVVALGLLRSGRGVPVHAEVFASMAMRWEDVGRALSLYRHHLETVIGNPGESGRPARERLINTLVESAERCHDLATYGPLGGSANSQRFAVAYADQIDWFDSWRQQEFALWILADEDLAARMEVIRQQGIEKIYELDATAVRVPELDSSVILDTVVDGLAMTAHFDADVSKRLLAGLVVERHGDPATRLLDSTYPQQDGTPGERPVGQGGRAGRVPPGRTSGRVPGGKREGGR